MFTIEWDTSKTIEGLRAMLEKLRDLTPAWRSVLKYLRTTATPQTFSSLGARIGQQWQPLSQPYATQKQRKYPGQPILRASDALFRSLTQDGAADSIASLTPNELQYGTRRPYARFHQQGAGRLPQRKFLALAEEDLQEIKQLVRQHLDNQARLSGFERL